MSLIIAIATLTLITSSHILSLASLTITGTLPPPTPPISFTSFSVSVNFAFKKYRNEFGSNVHGYQLLNPHRLKLESTRILFLSRNQQLVYTISYSKEH